MGAILPKPPSGKVSGKAFSDPKLMKRFHPIWGVARIQVGKPQSGDDGTWQQETLVLLQTLRTCDSDELAGGTGGGNSLAHSLKDKLT